MLQARFEKTAVLLPPDFLYPGILGFPVWSDASVYAFRLSKYPSHASQQSLMAFWMTWEWKDR